MANHISKHTGEQIDRAVDRALGEAIDIASTKFSGTLTKDIGDFKKGQQIENLTIDRVIQKLLFPYVAFSFSSISTTASAGTKEYGTTLTISKVTPSFTAGSESINSVKIGTTSGGSDLYSGSSATNGTAITLNTSKSFDGTNNGTIYCTLSDGTTTVTRSATVSYTYYTYSKLNSSTIPDTSGATKLSSDTASKEYTYAAGEYLWFYSRSSGKTIQTNVLGQWVDVATTQYANKITLTLANGTTAEYYAYRTDKFGEGASATYRLV